MENTFTIEDQEIDVEALKWYEHIRLRAGMYVGGLENTKVIIREVMDNVVDELYGSQKCDTMWVDTRQDNVVIGDNGRGYPITLKVDEYGITKTQVELGSSTLNAGSKFKTGEKNTVGIGMNGVGTKATNALSEIYVILSKITEENFDKSIPEVKEVWDATKDKLNLFYVIEYSRGIKVYEGAGRLSEICTKYNTSIPEGYSTIVFFKPDSTIFDDPRPIIATKSLEYVKLVMDKFYNKSISIYIDGEKMTDELNPYQFSFTSKVKTNTIENPEIGVYISFEYSPDLSKGESMGSVNGLETPSGLHIKWANTVLNSSLKSFFGITHNHVSNGLKFDVIFVLKSADFKGQVKEVLSTIHGVKTVDPFFQIQKDIFKLYKQNKEYFQLHVDRLNELAKSYENISAINKLKSLVSIASDAKNDKTASFIPAQVFDASSRNRKDCELFIVEGKSAAGTLVKSRDNTIHAILPLRGKPKNTTSIDFEAVLDNSEMRDLVATVGMGMDVHYQTKSPRYGKIVLAADAD